MPAEAASPLGCLEQWQWCNSAYPKESGCGPLASMLDSIYGVAPLFNITAAELDPARPSSPTKSGTRLIWNTLIQVYAASALSDILTQLGAKSLSSQSLLISGLQQPLPLNQWQLDVMNWYNTVLASLQASYVQTARGTTDPELQQAVYPPLNAEERTACNSQVRFLAFRSHRNLCWLKYICSPILMSRSENAKHRICFVQPIRTSVHIYQQHYHYSHLLHSRTYLGLHAETAKV